MQKEIYSLYHKIYSGLCGKPPYVKPWHFQWLATKELYRDLKTVLPTLKGNIIDVGCGEKPYINFLSRDKVNKYIGIDVYDGSNVDIVVQDGETWPVETECYDVVLCTQVLEHVNKPEFFVNEIERVLKVGGVLILTVPFIYNEHGTPYDFRRFTVFGAKNLLENKFHIKNIYKQGGIGSTIGLLFLNWMEFMFSKYTCTKVVKGILLPFWIIFCLILNIIGLFFDKIDRTYNFYSNIMIVCEKNFIGENI